MNTIKSGKTLFDFIQPLGPKSKIAHIIHPVVVDKTSDLVVAQPITFETMNLARKFCQGNVEVDLYAVQYHDEDRIPLPDCFIRSPDLTRSVSDVQAFQKKRKLALIKDILDSLYSATDADYMIYTNVDIAVQPYFYLVVSRLINRGFDAFIINRRTISDRYNKLFQIPRMYAEVGEKHPGWDCFIFKRDLYPSFILGTACIGTDWIGRMMISNMAPLASNFKIFDDLHMTFHIGDDRVWKSDEYADYAEHNKNECRKVLVDFDKKHGPFNRKNLPGRFLKKFSETGKPPVNG